MNPFEISISVRLNPVSDPTGQRSLSNDSQDGDTLVYGILPDQAAVDEVMRQLYELGVKMLQANTRSNIVSEIARELQAALEPRAACLN